MKRSVDPAANYRESMAAVGYVSRAETTANTYAELGFRCGLEIHQQLKTAKKLFCRCPAGLYQKNGEHDAEVVRHMRPTLSEMGEYDGTALMERKTRKNIFYHIKNETACTYDVDDTPPFPLNREALEIALEVALLLKTSIVSELHITRKQYLDGSIPTGFQRTGIVGIEGEIPLARKKVRIIQLSVEEDACREVSDIGHNRVYTTDRLGMPLIETVTYPDMLTPDEAAEAGHYLRFLARSTGKVRTGIGAAREDVNVSISGSVRVEIKGISRIARIPLLTHNEAFRHKALLLIRDRLKKSVADQNNWAIASRDVDYEFLHSDYAPLAEARRNDWRVTAVNLPGYAGILSHFTQPGQTFADELEGRVKVIACLERPNLIPSEQLEPVLADKEWLRIRSLLQAGDNDAQVIIWGPSRDVDTALETIEERCQLAFQGVPNETRKGLPNGQTIFERVLPGPDRMYPDTDSAPIRIAEDLIEKVRLNLPVPVSERLRQLRDWQVPDDTYHYLLRNNVTGIIEKAAAELHQDAKFVGTLLGHTLKHIEGKYPTSAGFTYNRVYELLRFLAEKELEPELAKEMLPVVYRHPNMDLESVLTTIGYKTNSLEQVLELIPVLKEKFRQINRSRNPHAYLSWVMGNLRDHAIGNIPLRDLKERVERAVHRG
ncbi:MAG: Glu-tRNA(Gln) amidotransferase subunit GatE [candidate division Zixibacteria bacterium]|nr:Glu-tRNA(Gln) amidotransferase subunit GatE [candidate division Zixibacteria bacterium]